MMKRTIHSLQPGSEAWHQHRAGCFNASEAAAVFGLHKFTSRTELLRAKHFGVEPEVTPEQQRIYDRGHRAEAFARPKVAAMIGDDLFPITASIQVEGLSRPLSASYDGLTMDEETIFECKLWSEELADAIMARSLGAHYIWQLEQQIAIIGARRAIFTIAEDKPDGEVLTMEYFPVAGRREELFAGWLQFDRDLKIYVPSSATPKVVAEPVETLPAVLVEVEGKVAIKSNMEAFGKALKAFVEKIPEKPTTDQEFANADAACKALKKAEDAIETERERALSSQEAVAALLKTMAELQELARSTRLATEKLVDRRKREIKEGEVERGRKALEAAVAEANKPWAPAKIVPMPAHDFANAIKGLRNLDSLRDAIDTHLANCTMKVTAEASWVAANLLHMTDTFPDKAVGKLLMPDLATQALKDPEDFKNMVAQRKAEHDRREAETKERAAREAEEKARRDAEEQQRRLAATPAPTSPPHAAATLIERMERDGIVSAADSNGMRSVIDTPASAAADLFSAPTGGPGGGDGTGRHVTAAAPSSPPALKLGEINRRIAPLSIDAAGLEVLGFKPAAKEGSAKLYHEADFKAMLNAMILRLEGAMNPAKAAA